MAGHDVKRTHPELYAPRGSGFHVVEVPAFSFLVVDGHGDPNREPAYAEAVTALFSLSYAARAVVKEERGTAHTVGPLEGLWSAADPRAFVERDKQSWDWTLMIWQPDWITSDVVVAATRRARRKALPALDRVRLTTYAEGTCVQVLHVGPYDDEGPVLARLHEEYLPQHGLTFHGRHHEIYLSDPRRTAPDRLRTILRQPVAPRGG